MIDSVRIVECPTGCSADRLLGRSSLAGPPGGGYIDPPFDDARSGRAWITAMLVGEGRIESLAAHAGSARWCMVGWSRICPLGFWSILGVIRYTVPPKCRVRRATRELGALGVWRLR